MFTKSETLKIKGIAILFLFFHHMYSSVGAILDHGAKFPVGLEVIAHLALCLRICVFIFSFLTCYGLSLQYQKVLEQRGSPLKFIVYRYIRGLAPFWIITLITWAVYIVVPNSPGYPNGWTLKSLPYMLGDFFAVLELFGQSQYMINGLAWYMNLLVVQIVLLPLLFPLVKKSGLAVIPITLVLYQSLPSVCRSPWGGEYKLYLFSMELGILMAVNQSFPSAEEWYNRLRSYKKPLLGFGLMLCSVFLPYLAIYKLKDNSYGTYSLLFTLGGMSAVFFSFLCIRWSYLEKVLALLGKYSGTMFLTHMFVIFNLKDIVFHFSSPIIQILSLVAITLIIAVCIEYIKKMIHYDLFINRLCKPFREKTT